MYIKACPHYTSDVHSMRIQSALISSALFTPFYECACDAHRTNPPREVVSIRIHLLIVGRGVLSRDKYISSTHVVECESWLLDGLRTKRELCWGSGATQTCRANLTSLLALSLCLLFLAHSLLRRLFLRASVMSR